MSAIKKLTDDITEAPPNWPSIDEVRAKVATDLSPTQQDGLALLMTAMTFADDVSSTFSHPMMVALRRLVPEAGGPTRLAATLHRHFETNRDVLADFSDPLHQSILVQVLHSLSTKGASAVGLSNEINYNTIKVQFSAKDVLFDVISRFFYLGVKAAKGVKPLDASQPELNTASLTEGKLEEIMRGLLQSASDRFRSALLVKHRYAGAWIQTLSREQNRIQDALKQFKKEPALPTSATFAPYTLSSNPLIAIVDMDINFPKNLSGTEMYVLLGLVGHAASADGGKTDPSEAKAIKSLIQRMKFPLIPEQFTAALRRPLDELLKAVTGPELAKAIYYETLVMITANLDVSANEKILLEKMATAFKLPQDLTVRLHARLYLDSGLRGVEDSLQTAPVQLGHSQKTLHRYQDLLTEMAIVELKAIVACGDEYLSTLEPLGMPKEAPTDVRVAALSLVGNAMRLDNVFDDEEQDFLKVVMDEYQLTPEALKEHQTLMKQSKVPDLCKIIKAWFVNSSHARYLPAVAINVLKAVGANGIIDEKEERFKSLFFKELHLDNAQYARLLLRAQLSGVVRTKE